MDYEQIPLLPQVEKKEKWDAFEDPPVNVLTASSSTSEYINFGEKLAKYLTYAIVFVVVLGGAVVSKGSLLFMTSQLSNKEITYCNEKLDRNKQFTVTIPQEERIVWMWMLMFAYFVPQIGTFLRSLRILLYKSWKKPLLSQFLTVSFTESCSTVGNAILAFIILPKLDVLKGIMLTNAFSFIPAVMIVISKLFLAFKENIVITSYKKELNSSSGRKIFVVDILCIVIQISAFFAFPLMSSEPTVWYIPLAIILISIGWWENYTVDYKNLRRSTWRDLAISSKEFSNSRYFTYLLISLWKCALFLLCMVLIEEFYGKGGKILFYKFTDAFYPHNITLKEGVSINLRSDFMMNNAISSSLPATVLSDNLTPVWVFIIFVTSTYFCYIFGKFACKTYIQSFSFAFPINLAVPSTICGLLVICGFYAKNSCYFQNVIPPYLFFNFPPIYSVGEFLTEELCWLWFLWLLSQLWITRHIWEPKAEKLAKTERLYVRPLYEPFLIDQDISMNRRRLDELIDDTYSPSELNDKQVLTYLADERDPQDIVPITEEDSITRIYACGTMWHETKEEMITFLKSVVRMDNDQCARRIVKNYLRINIPDYYELETHIFFDDAFVRKSQDDPDPQLNSFVKNLIEGVDKATSIVHEVHMKVTPPVKYVTPYGGKLVWTLPGKTRLIVHLKDNKKIRPKKRWSQVMYMYYILGHMLVERDGIDDVKKALRSHNTYILALDGDIDFQPKAVHLLVDLMKKDESLGAACGRIHPIGSGIMAWYQMFEYAVGHWLQKATEHVIGCVLCSPGCFTLFRGSALMDVSVMRKYATKSSEALHYVQFDQGEDRWLSTLLLQRGYRVEYSAAADAYTHCPEGFNEFFNQRRRWIPSTTANILDLLINYKSTVKVNNSISKLYILYQSFLMVGTILGPGTIFLMLIGAFVAAFQLDQWSSFVWNSVPVMIFVLTCSFYPKDKTQLFMAGLLSAVYCLVMMAVLVGIILQIKDDGILAPSSLFFFCVAAQLISVAILHPKEFNCLKYGLIYYATVPSMYMILIIYSIFNMNNVSWGTRELTVTSADKQTSKQKQDSFKNKFWNFVDKISKRLFAENKGAEKSKLDIIIQKLEAIESRNPKEKGEQSSNDEVPKRHSLKEKKGLQLPDSVFEGNWANDASGLKYSQVGCLPGNEKTFWENLLQKYLYPVDDTEDKARIAENLKDLRDKAVVSFFMINAIFVLVVFLLTLKKGDIFIRWPLNIKSNFTYNTAIDEIVITRKYLELEPIGVVFLLTFFLVLLIQYIGMLIHRFGTFSQIMANTSINIFNKSPRKMTQDDIISMDPVKFVKKLQSVKDFDEDEEANMVPFYTRRATLARLEKANKVMNDEVMNNDLEENFRRRTQHKLLGQVSSSKMEFKEPNHIMSTMNENQYAYDINNERVQLFY